MGKTETSCTYPQSNHDSAVVEAAAYSLEAYRPIRRPFLSVYGVNFVSLMARKTMQKDNISFSWASLRNGAADSIAILNCQRKKIQTPLLRIWGSHRGVTEDPGTRWCVVGWAVPGMSKERSAFIFKGQPDQRKIFFDNMALICIAIYIKIPWSIFFMFCWPCISV